MSYNIDKQFRFLIIKSTNHVGSIWYIPGMMAMYIYIYPDNYKLVGSVVFEW